MSTRRPGLRGRLLHEVRETARNPRRVARLGSGAAVRDLRATLRGEDGPAIEGGAWTERDDGAFIGRSYASYDEYRAHQAAKLESVDLSSYDVRYRALLADRLRQSGHVTPAMSVLCLAARLGTEVKAFHDLGSFAVGIDLNPGPGNRYVLHGDFHDLQFPDGSVDVVFTNSLDHAFEPDRIFAEVRRVLRPQGLFVAEISRGRAEGHAPRDFESFYWNTADDLLALIERHGFESGGSPSEFDEPWPGLHVTLRVGSG